MIDTHLRSVDLDGYRLDTWDAERCDRMGKSVLGYRLSAPDGEAIFAGEDFACSPLDAIDSDSAVRGILSFLTLRPGDTDAEYFEGYTARQREFAECEAESLQLWAMDDGPEFDEIEEGDEPW